MAPKRLQSELNVGETKIARKNDPSTVSLLNHYFDPQIRSNLIHLTNMMQN